MPINGTKPEATVSDGVRMHVRAPETTPLAPGPRDSNREAAYTRAIPRSQPIDQPADAHRVRNFASRHLVDARTALGGSWVATEVPMTIGAAARQVVPAKGRTSGRVMWTVATGAGVIRFAVVSLCWLAVILFAGRIRASVSTVVIVGLIVAHYLAG